MGKNQPGSVMIKGAFDNFTWMDIGRAHGSPTDIFDFKDAAGAVQVDDLEYFLGKVFQMMFKVLIDLLGRGQVIPSEQILFEIPAGNGIDEL